MGHSLSDDSQPFELAEKGLFKDAADAIDQMVEVPTALQVLRAELAAQLTSQTAARGRAESLLALDLTNKEKADCWAIIGRAHLREGQLQHGLRAMNRAMEAAAETREPIVEARLRDKYVSSLLHWVSVESASVEMPKLRQFAVRAGDARSLTVFHILAAAINARRGHFPSAHSHLEIGRGLLQQFENEWLRGRLAVIAAAASLLQSDYVAALKHVDEAHVSARRSGSREILLAALGNSATLTLAQGNFEQTKTLLSELLLEVRRNGNTNFELNVHSTSIDLALADRDLKAARDAHERAARIVSPEGRSLYHLYFLLSRVRLLYAQGEVEKGLEVATKALSLIHQVSDTDLLRRMKLLAAEGLGRVGRPLEAATLVFEVSNEEPACSIEILAESSRVIGQLAAREDAGAARDHFHRAQQIFEGSGNIASRDDARRDETDTLGPGGPTRDRDDATSQSVFLQASDRVVALLQFGVNPLLLGRELLSCIASSDAFLAATVIEVCVGGSPKIIGTYRSNDTPSNDTNHEHRIALGTLGNHAYQLVAVPKPTVGAISALTSFQRLAQTAIALCKARYMEREPMALWPNESSDHQLGLICTSDDMKELLRTTRQVSDSNLPVLLTGETGVGKELFAKALHQASQRSDRTFLPFNCSTVPREMIDSQLFGHKRGSFTGAVGDSAGVIRSAAGGTLFLDEIGEMSLESQPKLLRFLESGEILPLGETKPQHVDVRVVAATNAKLDELVADGRFREDLYYRLNVIRINIPPLRERREEIPALAEHFLARFGNELQKPLVRIADETLEYLVLYRWPGNVRQLANEIRRLVAMAEPGAVIMPAHLTNEIFESRRTLPANRSPRLFDEVVTRIDQPLSAMLEHVERAAIQRALAVTDGHLDEAARILGLSRKGLYLKRQRLNLG